MRKSLRKSLLCCLVLLGMILPHGKSVTEQDVVGPKPTNVPNLVDYLEKDGEFKLLLSALKAAGLTETLRTGGEYTLLAPVDDAFRHLPDDYLSLLMAPSGKQKLAALLGLHIIPGRHSSLQLFSGSKTATFQGQEIPLRIMAGNYLFDQSKLIQPDIQCSNGLIQVVDRVLQPLQ